MPGQARGGGREQPRRRFRLPLRERPHHEPWVEAQLRQQRGQHQRGEELRIGDDAHRPARLQRGHHGGRPRHRPHRVGAALVAHRGALHRRRAGARQQAPPQLAQIDLRIRHPARPRGRVLGADGRLQRRHHVGCARRRARYTGVVQCRRHGGALRLPRGGSRANIARRGDQQRAVDVEQHPAHAADAPQPRQAPGNRPRRQRRAELPNQFNHNDLRPASCRLPPVSTPRGSPTRPTWNNACPLATDAHGRSREGTGRRQRRQRAARPHT